jgi:hypothetical protein
MEESCVVVTVVQGRRCVGVEFSEVFGIGWGFVFDRGSGSGSQVRVARVLSVMTRCLSKTKVTDRPLTRLRERQFRTKHRGIAINIYTIAGFLMAGSPTVCCHRQIGCWRNSTHFSPCSLCLALCSKSRANVTPCCRFIFYRAGLSE